MTHSARQTPGPSSHIRLARTSSAANGSYASNGLSRAHREVQGLTRARGFTQVYGVDYTETFASIAKMSSLQTILATATRLDWPIEVFNFNSAFLNGELDEEIYMALLSGCGFDTSHVARLHKAIYGLNETEKTAPSVSVRAATLTLSLLSSTSRMQNSSLFQ